MKQIKKGDMVFTATDCGIVTWVGVAGVMMDNNVNEYRVWFKDIVDVL